MRSSRSRLLRALTCLLLLVATAVSAPAATAFGSVPLAADPEALDRLVALARLWGTVEYFHPWLAYRDIDWDRSLVEALPEVLAATDAEEYAAAVEGMLAGLQDPVTRVLADGPGPEMAPGPADERAPDAPLVRPLDDGLLLLDLRDTARLGNWVAARQELMSAEFTESRGVIVDLRPLPGNGHGGGIAGVVFSMAGVASRLTTEPVVGPGQRHRSHLGFAPWEGVTSGGYQSAFRTIDGARIEPAANARDLPVAFVVNRAAPLPSEALALQTAGRGVIVAEGGIDPGALLSTHEVDLGEGVSARVRLGELVAADGSGGVAPDVVLEPGADPMAVARAALAALDVGAPSRPGARRLPAHGRARGGTVEAGVDYPGIEERLLAGIRIWTVIDLFFPYGDLMDEDWDTVLREALPRLEEAADARQYHLAVAEMYAHIDDTHGFVRSPVLSEVFGRAPSPVRARWIEDRPVVTGFWSQEAAEIAATAGVEIGDVILEVDGADAVERVRETTPFIAASTPDALMGRAVDRLLTGVDDSTVRLVLEGSDGSRTVELPRSSDYYQGAAQRQGEVVRQPTPEIGYADLDRLQPSQVGAMFDRFRDTRAIVFDMRGYPNGTAWAIAPYLSAEPRVVAALFERPWVLGPGPRDRQVYTFEQRIPPPGPGVFHYPGRTVMLVDERTISQAEHTGLFFEAANGTEFIGSPSNGANGDVTNFFVPGGIRLSFTGQSVRHADGRQLQRVGLQPIVEVRPTIAGLRAGRDEVLEAALRYLESGE